MELNKNWGAHCPKCIHGRVEDKCDKKHEYAWSISKCVDFYPVEGYRPVIMIDSVFDIEL